MSDFFINEAIRGSNADQGFPLDTGIVSTVCRIRSTGSAIAVGTGNFRITNVVDGGSAVVGQALDWLSGDVSGVGFEFYVPRQAANMNIDGALLRTGADVSVTLVSAILAADTGTWTVTARATGRDGTITDGYVAVAVTTNAIPNNSVYGERRFTFQNVAVGGRTIQPGDRLDITVTPTNSGTGTIRVPQIYVTTWCNPTLTRSADRNH